MRQKFIWCTCTGRKFSRHVIRLSFVVCINIVFIAKVEISTMQCISLSLKMKLIGNIHLETVNSVNHRINM